MLYTLRIVIQFTINNYVTSLTYSVVVGKYQGEKGRKENGKLKRRFRTKHTRFKGEEDMKENRKQGDHIHYLSIT